MHRHLRHQLWIVAAAAVVVFTNLGAVALWDEDEPLYASCAREMLQRGDWVVPTFNGEMFAEKPPLTYWLMMVSYRLLGVTEFAARFSSAVLAIGTALLTYHLGRLLFRAEVGFWAGLIVVTSIIFTVSARAATMDSALVFLTTAAVLCLVAGGLAKERETGPAASRDESGQQSGQRAAGTPSLLSTAHSPLSTSHSPLVPRSWLSFVLFYACLGLAVLVKGPIGLLLPVAMIGLFLLIADRLQESAAQRSAARGPLWQRTLIELLRVADPRRVLRIAWAMRPLTGAVIVAAVALPWYVLVDLRTDGAFLAEFLGEQNFGRALKPLQGHGGPFFYYLPAIAVGFFPWSVFLTPTVIRTVRRIRQRHLAKPGIIFAACWLLVFVVFWSIPSTKLPHYVLPAYPALALLTALFIDTWITNPASVSRWWLRSATTTLIVVGIGMMVALPIVAWILLPGEWMLGLVGVVLVVGGGLGLWHSERGRPFQTMATFAVTAVTFLTAIFGFAALRVDRHQNAPVLTAAIRSASPGTPRLAGYRFFRESLVFYAGKPVPRYEHRDAERLEAFLHETEYPYLVTTDEHEEELRRLFPGELSVLIRRPRFLRSGQVVVLTRRLDRGVPQLAAEPPTTSRQ